MKRVATLIILLGVATIVGIGGRIAWDHFQEPESIGSPVAGALIGGPFELVDHTGKTVTQDDFKGKFMLIYFGYTYCPDVCPTELQDMTAALDALGDKADRIQPIFITVDPQRDTPELMAEYVANFYPGMIGLTGTEEQIAAAAKAYRIYYAKVAEDENDPYYLMDHSSIIYLMDEGGKLAAYFNSKMSPEDMAKAIADRL